MNTRQIQFIVFLLGCALALGGCAKEVAEEAPVPDIEEPIPEEVVEPPTVEEEMPVEAEEVVEEATLPEEVVEEPVVIPIEEPTDVEQGGLESGSYLYMIRHGDYLVKIATNEYGDPTRWRSIYDWNRELIGDNPNLIYPYHELELRKPEYEITRWSYEYTVHVVEQGETLWSIAGEEYNDEIAWIVIFWDNEETLDSNAGQLKPGMELQIRTELWPSR